VIGNLSVLQRRLGELTEARASIERALAIFQTIKGPDNPEVARSFINLGIVQQDMGEFREALTSFERAAAIYVAAYGPDHREFGRALIRVGTIQLRLGKLREARASFERAVPIIETADEFLGRDSAENIRSQMDWGYIKRHKTFGLFLFVFYATVQSLWRTGRSDSKPAQESRQVDPAPDHQPRGDRSSADQNASSSPGSDDQSN
jgi:tetratricopeptide (TPR) repeat protein